MKLTAFHRLHVALADMGFASPRAYGGIGVTLDEPRTVIECVRSDTFALSGFDSIDVRVRSRIEGICHSILANYDAGGVEVVLRESALQHVGFGTTTTLTLAIISAIDAVCGLKMSERDMQLMSGRGGASGIGIHSFFRGGVIWDCGHALEKGSDLTPSSAGPRSGLPPLIARLTFPRSWRILLFLPKDCPLGGEKEISFFRENTPIPANEALETMALLYHGILPAIKLADLSALSAALRGIHNTGFKKRELDARSPTTRDLISKLQQLDNVAAGMSSVGPLIYAIFDAADDDAAGCLTGLLTDYVGTVLGCARGANRGFVLEGEKHATKVR